MKLFNLDSPLMRFLSRMTDILWLNILVLIFFVPPGAVYYLFASHIVAEGASYMPTTGTMFLMYALILIAAIPIGAAFTGMHYVLLKMARDEEGYITKDFFKSFKLNFRQASIIWTIALLVIVLLVIDYRSLSLTEHPTFLFAAITVAVIFMYCTLLYVFPVLSHFENTIKGTVKNSFFMSILALPKTVLMAILTAIPVAIMYFVERFEVMVWLIPLTMLFWFSLPAYFCAKLYDKTFKRFEPETAQTNDDFSWSVNAEEEASEADNSDDKTDSPEVETEGEGDKENSSEA
ncbi:MAG: DUF624 domain-containing protein [Lachnospiraceae bacterium]|nr:DUF624 domain-containing protein [Lachnospiraceae bacterium]